MRQLIRHQIVTRSWHRCASSTALLGRSTLLCGLTLLTLCKVHAQDSRDAAESVDPATVSAGCLPGGNGYLRARLDGAMKAELNWGNADTECTGAVRPTDGGIRMRFTASLASGEKLVLVFGIAKLREGATANAIPVNVTVIREGTGEFYGTQGDDKCMLDEVRQEPIVGIPHRARSYRIIARGFCTEPARAIRGKGSILISRFDYAGRVDFDNEDKTAAEPQVAMR
jgi:hypothetical protein